MAKHRSNSIGGNTIVASGDQLGTISFQGSDGSEFVAGAQIAAEVDGTPGTNDMPSRLVFSTTADGAASPTERFRIGSAGQLGIGGATYGTAGQVLTSGGASAAPTWTSASGGITSGTAVASTSGTSIDFTGIPAGVKQVTVMFNGVSTNGSSQGLIQLGSGSFTTSGYTSQWVLTGIGTSNGTVSTGLSWFHGSAGEQKIGHLVITNVSGNLWVCSGVLRVDSGYMSTQAGNVTLSGTLDRVRITTVNGTDTFDAGSINIQYQS